MYPPTIFLFNITMTMTMTITTDPSNSSSIIISIFIGICMSLIALITAFGNIIVLLAFYCDNKLRTINDYFILNMAIADFLIGSFCIPFYIPFSITQIWPFGRLFCKIWVTIDDVATMASVINIVAISINRYWSIAYPISYRKYVRQHFVYIVMGGVWCVSFINFAPGIWLLGLFHSEDSVTNITRNDCSGDYNNSFVYMLIAQFNYFIWPFIVLCALNMLIMLNIWKRSRKMSRLTTLSQSVKTKEENIGSSPYRMSKTTEDDQHLSILSRQKINSIEPCPSIIVEENENSNQTSSSNKNVPHLSDKQNKNLPDDSHHTITYLSSYTDKKSPTMKNSSRNYLTENPQPSAVVYLSQRLSGINYPISQNHRCNSLIEDAMESEMEMSRPMISKISSSTKSTSKCQVYRQGQSRIIRDRKAARSLFILVIVFLIFLFPYVICATAATAGVNISTIIFETSFWLLWMNSTCNPFLYPFIQIKYRRAYVKLFQSCAKYLTFTRSNHDF